LALAKRVAIAAAVMSFIIEVLVVYYRLQLLVDDRLQIMGAVGVNKRRALRIHNVASSFAFFWVRNVISIAI